MKKDDKFSWISKLGDAIIWNFSSDSSQWESAAYVRSWYPFIRSDKVGLLGREVKVLKILKHNLLSKLLWIYHPNKVIYILSIL